MADILCFVTLVLKWRYLGEASTKVINMFRVAMLYYSNKMLLGLLLDGMEPWTPIYPSCTNCESIIPQ